MSTTSTTPVIPPADDLDPTIKALLGVVDETAPDAGAAATPDPAARRAGRSITDVIDEKDDTTPPAATTKPAATPPADDGAAAGAAKPDGDTGKPPAERPIKVRKSAPPAAPVYTPPVQQAAPPPAKTKTADEEFEETLLPEEKEQLENARYAESKFPKHAGLAARTAKFLKDHAALTAKNDFDPESDEYKAWLAKNSVLIAPKDVREIERERDRESLRAENDRQLAETHDDVFKQLEEPKVKAEADQLYNQLAAQALPDDLVKAIRDRGPAAAEAEFPIEFRVATQIAAAATSDMEEFMRITRINPRTGRSLRAYDPANPQHARIVEFVNATCDNFKATGGKQLVRGNQTFLPRIEYNSLPKERRAQFWTFSNSDIMEQAKATAKVSIKNLIQSENARLAAMGFTRAAKPAAAAPVAPPAGAPPAPRSSPGSGLSGGKTPDDPIDMSLKILHGE